MRHLCKVHSPLIQEWFCTTGTCKVSFDRKNSKGQDARGVMAHGDYTHMMVNNDYWWTLFLNTADYKPVSKRGEVVTTTPKRKSDSGVGGSHSDLKKSKREDPSFKSSRGRLSATPAFDPTKHEPAPMVPGSTRA